MKKPTNSRTLFARASQILPGGVDSPVRAFQAVGGAPLFVRRASGATLEDVDGNRFVDYVMSWGPLIHGHAPGGLVRAIAAAARRGTSFGAPSALEHELGERVRALMPSIERVRFVSSGTEAAMTAIRVARAFTGRTRIVKFAGCYHGHADAFLVKAGSGALTLGVPTSPGVPAAVAAETLIARYNDLRSVDELIQAQGSSIAAIIVEPIAGNIGVVAPAEGFLAGLRDRCTRHGIALIFDEVISGFRASPGGAQAIFDVRPDLTCLGKIIGGGLPVGAYGGSRTVMSEVAPLGGVYQAGTLSGNPLAVAAGLTAIRALADRRAYARLERLGAQLEQGLREGAGKSGVPLAVNRVGSMLTAFFCAGPVRDYASARQADTASYARFFQAMLARGVYLAPSQFEAAFVSLAHSEADIEQAARAAAEALGAAS